MALPSSSLHQCLLLVLATFAIVEIALAGDPDILTDFIVPENLTSGNGNSTIDGNFFTFTGFRVLVGGEVPPTFKVFKAGMLEFPALNGQSVAYAALQFPPGTTNPPHTHPRASELIFVLDGTLEVGLIDTANKLYTQTLQTGDLFVFPKGLVHFQFNADAQKPVLAISAFGSANAGTVSIPSTVFATGIDDNILALSFKTDVATIKKIKAGLVPKV